MSKRTKLKTPQMVLLFLALFLFKLMIADPMRFAVHHQSSEAEVVFNGGLDIKTIN